jgi:malate dehydrogenase (oxaloacetate-decarboxylating)
LVLDKPGILRRSDKESYDFSKRELAEITNPNDLAGDLAFAVQGADVFIGVSVGNILTTEMVKTMNKDAVIFAMANPTPEIMPEDALAGGAKIVGTGRSDYPNQINNVLVFPGLFKGALRAKSKKITEEMKLAAARGLASLITDEEMNENYIIPDAFDKRVADAVADAVEKVAKEQGICRD